jgi:hypothetical protein
LTNLLGGVTKFVRRHALTLPAVLLILVLGMSYLLFYLTSIEPAIGLRSSLASELTNEQKALGDVTGRQQDNPQVLQNRLAIAESTLTASVSSFLTESDANQVIAVLYQNAGASGVTISDLQSQNPALNSPTATPTTPKPSATPQPAPTTTGTVQATPKPAATVRPTPTPASVSQITTVVSVMNVRLQAVGTSRQLVDFVSRLKGQLIKGTLIKNVSITGGDGIATLTMDISLYVTTIDR